MFDEQVIFFVVVVGSDIEEISVVMAHTKDEAVSLAKEHTLLKGGALIYRGTELMLIEDGVEVVDVVGTDGRGNS